MTRDEIAVLDPEALFMDGFDEAICGYFQRCGQPLIVTYDWDACLAVLLRQGMAEDAAIEYLDYNCEGAWVGDRTPAILHRGS